MPFTPTITSAEEVARLGPFIAAEEAADAGRERLYQADLARNRGSLHGALPMAAPVERTYAERLIAARKAYESAMAFDAAPRGRFLAALRLIRESGAHGREAEQARKAFNRGFQDGEDAYEIGVALKALAAVPGDAAAAARDALADLLMASTKAAA